MNCCLTARSWVLEKVKLARESKKFRRFVEPAGSLPWSQEPETIYVRKQMKPNYIFQPHFPKFSFDITLYLNLPNVLSCKVCQQELRKHFFFSPCALHFSLTAFFLTWAIAVFDEEHKLWSFSLQTSFSPYTSVTSVRQREEKPVNAKKKHKTFDRSAPCLNNYIAVKLPRNFLSLWRPKNHFRVHKSPPLNPALRQ
jgi:hypothetical protein